MRRDLEGTTKSLPLAGHFQMMPGEGALCIKHRVVSACRSGKLDIAAFHRKPDVLRASSQGRAVPGPCRHLTAPAPGGAGPGGEGAASPRRAAAPGGGRRPLHRPLMAPTPPLHSFTAPSLTAPRPGGDIHRGGAPGAIQAAFGHLPGVGGMGDVQGGARWRLGQEEIVRGMKGRDFEAYRGQDPLK